MSASDQFLARVLEVSAEGYAGMAASRLIEEHPTLEERYPPSAFSSWKSQLRQWVLELSGALDAGEPALFASRVLWTRKAYLARGASVDDLRAALVALRETLDQRLPEGKAEAATGALDRAMAALESPPAEDDSVLDASRPGGRLALGYLKSVLEGDLEGAKERVLAATDDGMPVTEVYTKVLLPALREVGRMWHVGELSVVEEHLVTGVTRRVMTILCERVRPRERNGKTVVSACVAGNVHDVGVRAIADFFDMAGWRAINLGADVPGDQIARSVQFFDADLVVIAATLGTQLRAVRRSIERIRSLEDRDVKIIVGGLAFDGVPSLWQKLDADGYAACLEDAEPLGRRLTGGHD